MSSSMLFPIRALPDPLRLWNLFSILLKRQGLPRDPGPPRVDLDPPLETLECRPCLG